jgi:peptidoglycan hydrolase-like protein with peptidoglycan-binding domain
LLKVRPDRADQSLVSEIQQHTIFRSQTCTTPRQPGRGRRLGLVAAVVATGALAGTTTVAVAAPQPTVITAPSTLSIGSEGDGVRQLQQALIDAGVSVIGGADGQFGAMTAQALREFQLGRGLMPTGSLNDATRAALLPENGSVAPSVLGLSQGATGSPVAALQQALTDVGVNVGPVDGIFGALTAAGLRSYQEGRGISVTGTLDAETVKHLAARATTATESNISNAADGDAGGNSADHTSDNEFAGLGIGSTGPRVMAAQQALQASGLTFLGGADGVFGPATANAVRLFQSNRGLEVTGSIDAETAAALGGAGPAPTGDRLPLQGLAPGSNGELVAELQRKLIAVGLEVRGGADGIFGPVTANALKQFQTERSLEVTGRVNEATARALGEVTAVGASQPTAVDDSSTGYPVFGEQGARVRAMQQALIDAGSPVPGGVDGIFGTMTAGAIMNFQRSRSLEATGTITEQTAQSLGLTPAAAQAAPPARQVDLEAFPVQGQCHYSDTWHAPRGGGRLHEGTDIIAAEGRYIYAVTSGTITSVIHDRPGSRAGNALRLTTSDGTYFFYAHLQSFADGIENGVPVKAGQILGYNGSTGNAGIPHLHFEIHPGGGAAVNPYPALRAVNGCSTDKVPAQP